MDTWLYLGEQANLVFKLGCQMAKPHSSLQSHYKGTGKKLFNLTNKTHFVLHSLQLSGHIRQKLVVLQKRDDDASPSDLMAELFVRSQALACFQEGCPQREAPSLSEGQGGAIVRVFASAAKKLSACSIMLFGFRSPYTILYIMLWGFLFTCGDGNLQESLSAG